MSLSPTPDPEKNPQQDTEETQENNIPSSFTSKFTGIYLSPSKGNSPVQQLILCSDLEMKGKYRKSKESKKNDSDNDNDSFTSVGTTIEKTEKNQQVTECTTPGDFLKSEDIKSCLSNINSKRTENQDSTQIEEKSENNSKRLDTTKLNQENNVEDQTIRTLAPDNQQQVETESDLKSNDKEIETDILEEQEEFEDEIETFSTLNENINPCEMITERTGSLNWENNNSITKKDPSKKKINDLRKQVLEFKQDLKEANKTIETLKCENMCLNEKLKDMSSLSQERDKSFKQLKGSIFKIKEQISFSFNNNRQEIMKCKQIIPEINQKVKDLEKALYVKQDIMKLSSQKYFKQCEETIKKRVQILVDNEGKKNLEYERQLNYYTKTQKQVEWVILNLKLFEVDLSDIINDMLKVISDNNVDEDKEDIDISKLFEKKFKEQHNNIIGFRTKDDNYILGEMSLFLDQMKVTINEKLIKEVENCMLKLNSTKDQTYLAFENKITDFQKMERTLKAQIEEAIERINDLQRINDKINKEKNVISIKLETQVNIAESNAQRLIELIGDETKKITYDQMSLNNSDTSRDTYDFLEVDDVDKLTIVESQNVIKNLIILLNIPFSKLAKKIPLIGIYLIYERNLYAYFANRLYYQLHGKQIMLADYNREAFNQYVATNSLNNIRHPLEECLETLCNCIITKL